MSINTQNLLFRRMEEKLKDVITNTVPHSVSEREIQIFINGNKACKFYSHLKTSTINSVIEYFNSTTSHGTIVSHEIKDNGSTSNHINYKKIIVFHLSVV